MTTFDSLPGVQKIQTQRGLGLLAAGMLLAMVALNAHTLFPQVIVGGKDWAEFLHGFAAGLAIVMEVSAIALLILARTSVRGSKS